MNRLRQVAAQALDGALAEAEVAMRRAAAELDTLLADLERWVNVDSPSGVRDALDALASDIATTLGQYGLEAELVPSEAGLYVHAVVEGDGRTRVALLGHHDTVFPRGTALARPFRRVDDRVLGPGVADMKGGLVVAAHAARSLAGGSRPFGRLEFVSVPDEEPRAVPFATLDRLAGFDAVLCLECGRPGGSVVTARKGGRWVEVRALGRGAHAGAEPERARNPILALAREALRIAGLDGRRDGVSVQVTGLRGGEVANAVPADALLFVDVRAWTATDLDWAVEEIARFENHEGIELRMGTVLATPPLERTPAVAALARTAARVGSTLGAPVGEVATGGASDGCWTAGIGIPTLDGLGPVGGFDHTADEYAEVDSFATRCGIVAGLVAAVEAGVVERESVLEPLR